MALESAFAGIKDPTNTAMGVDILPPRKTRPDNTEFRNKPLIFIAIVAVADRI